jgi:hypothetical protein
LSTMCPAIIVTARMTRINSPSSAPLTRRKLTGRARPPGGSESTCRGRPA